MTVLVAAPVLALLAWFAADEGGYEPGQWYPATLVLLGLVVVLASTGAGGLRGRAAVIAVSAFAAYAAWSYLSVAWADAPGTALQGSHRTVAYLAAFAVFALLPWSRRALVGATAAWTLAVAVVAVVTLARLARTTAPLELFNDGRLAEPLGYPNATAALWTAAGVTAIVLASRREVHVALRALMLGAAGMLLELAVLSQSRGWLAALPVIALLVVALTPNRVRLLLHAIPVGIALVLASDALLEPYAQARSLPPADQARELLPTLDPLVSAVGVSAIALVLVGAAVALLDRAREIPDRVQRAGGRVAVVLAVLAAAAGVAVGLAATDGDPGERISSGWAEFKDFETYDGAESRFSSLGTTRYDFWRVATDEFAAHPVTGLGQDNFAQAYMTGRRSAFEEPRWVHSLPLRLLAHTGLVGALLFLIVIVAVAAALLTRAPAPVRAARAAAVVPLVVWLAHGSVDWLWEFPGLSIAALAFAGAATAVGRPLPPPRSAFAMPVRWGAAGLAVVCAGAILLAYVAERDVDRAAGQWAASPDAARQRLARATDLAPLDARPLIVRGVIEQRLGRLDVSRRFFERAARRERRDWFARFELGLIAGQQGDRRRAREALMAARTRNPLDPLVRLAIRRLGQGRPLTFAEAERAARTRVQRRLGRPVLG